MAASITLLLDEVAEPPPDVAGAYRVGRSIALDGHPQREAVTLVARVLVGDPLDDRLRALEAPRRVEVRALRAGVDGGSTLRALLERRGCDRQDGAAPRTPRERLGGQHSAASRRLARRTRRRRAAVGVPTWLAAIALLPVLSVAHACAPSIAYS